MEIDFGNFIKNDDLFIKHLNNNILSYSEKILKADYIKNKNNYSDIDKKKLKNTIKIFRGGKMKDEYFDIYSYVLAEMYDIESSENKQKIVNHFKNKLTQSGGTGTIEALDLASNALKGSFTLPQKNEMNEKMKQYFESSVKDMFEKGTKNSLITGPVVSNILSIGKELEKMSADEIHKLTEQQTINRLFVHLGNLTNLKSHSSNDIKDVVDFFKSHSILSMMYLNGVIDEINKSTKEKPNFDDINKKLDIHQDQLSSVIKKITTISEFIKNATEELKKEEDYNIFPLDVKIVSSAYLGKKYGDKKEYYIDTDSIKSQFPQIPKSVNAIVQQIRKRAKDANKKVPGVATSIFTSVKNVETFNSLIKDLKLNSTDLQIGGTDSLSDGITPDLLIKAEASQVSNVLFSNTVNTRKETSAKIFLVGQLINQLDTKIDELVKTIEYFNLNESREHYFSYVMSNLALNANNRRKYRYMSFGVLDFYKSVIDTIFKKINHDRNGEEKLVGSDSKFLFFYHYHFKIIKKLKIFLDKFYELKNLNIFYTNNTFIEIAECTGKVKEYLSLLNIYKYLLDDFYSKIGLGKSSGNVSVYLRINDFPRIKMLLGRQYGTIYGNSQLNDSGTGEKDNAFIYNVELLNRNNSKYIFQNNENDEKNLIKRIKEIESKKYDKFEDKIKAIFEELLDKEQNPKFRWQQHTGGLKYSNLMNTSLKARTPDNMNDGDKLYYVKEDDNGKELFDSAKEVNDYITRINDADILAKEVMYTLKSTNPTLSDLYKERERKRFFLVNRKVPTVKETEYTSESDKLDKFVKIEFKDIKSGLGDSTIKEQYDRYIAVNDNTERPFIAKIVFLPLLNLLKDESKTALGLNDLFNDFTKTGLHTSKLKYQQKIVFFDKTDKTNKTEKSESIDIDFNENVDAIKYYVNYMNDSKIIYPFMIGFIPYSIFLQATNVIKYNLFDEIDDKKGVYSKYRNKFEGLQIAKFHAIGNLGYNPVSVFAETDNFDDNIPPNKIHVEKIQGYHYLLKKYFKSLFYEQTEEFRDESEMIFTASQDDKKLIVSDKEKCRRLLDRYVNEEDFGLLDNIPGSRIETPFNHVFSSEKTPDNESIAMFMSIPSKLSMGNGFMLLTFGYSGTGKTYTVFGKSPDRGILQSTLSEVDKEDDEIYFRCYEVYGIGFPYANYWYDKLYNSSPNSPLFDPKRTELLIHHNFKPDGDKLSIVDSHVFDDPDLKKLYLNNNNWFFPDAGTGEYKVPLDELGDQVFNGYEAEFLQSDTPPSNFDDCVYVGNAEHIYDDKYSGVGSKRPPWIPYIKYNNDEQKSYFTPRVYSSYEDKKITEVKGPAFKVIPTDDYTTDKGNKIKTIISSSTPNNLKKTQPPTFKDMKKIYIDYNDQENKSNSTYIKMPIAQINSFDQLVEKIDETRKKKLGTTKTYYNDTKDSMPETYKYIKRIKETANNPESSRSIIFYEFVVKLKEPQEVTIEDEYGRKITVWRKYVTLLIVDLPGQEDIKTSFVEKPEYNVTGPKIHEPVFDFNGKPNTTIENEIKNSMKFTYKDKDKIKDTNSDPLVYRYNEYLQKMIKSTLYMNPLFKFMSKLTANQNEKFNVNVSDVSNDFILCNAWSIEGAPKIVDYPYGTSKKSQTQQFIDHSNFVKIQDSTRGSALYRNNIEYILNGIRQYQENPFNFLVNYVFDDITKAENQDGSLDIYKALSPYEGYMINENVGSLITYLYNKTKPKGKDRKIHSIKNQQHNFGSYLIDNKLYPIDMDINANDISNADSGIPSAVPVPIMELNSQDINGVGYGPINSTKRFDGRNIPLEVVKPSVINRDFDSLVGTLEKPNANCTGIWYIDQIFDNKNIDKLSVPYKDELYHGKGYSPKFPPIPTSTLKNNVDNSIAQIRSNGIDTTITPLRYFNGDRPGTFFKNFTSNYDNYIKCISLSSMWTTYIKFVYKYMFYIEIFLILKKLRGIDKYFREKTMAHMLNSSNLNGRIMPNQKIFNDNFNRLKDMYDFYVGNIITYTKGSLLQGIYNKNYLFRNGDNNDYLSQWDTYFYRDRSTRLDNTTPPQIKKSGNIIVSDKSDLENTYPELEMLNKKPLIFSYLEPYEPFFNTYSLLYVMSNNDPHTKCYKQIELLNENKKFMDTIVNI
jgi:hypothetical protein